MGGWRGGGGGVPASWGCGVTAIDRTEHLLERRTGEDVCPVPTYDLVCRACARHIATSLNASLLKVRAWHHEDAYHRHPQEWWDKQ